MQAKDVMAAGARDVATSDTIRHPSNRFSVIDRLADGTRAVSARIVQGRI
jgi:hypothetical protein